MNFVVYKSSAGSGKTFTLVKEYLALVLDNPYRYKNILAITFTNKAANEMKERILDYLVMLSDPTANKDSKPVTVLMPVFSERLNLDEKTLAARAAKVLELILHNYGEFSIGTIDSFIHRIVRTFAHDLHLPVNFDVELDNDRIITEAVDLLISRVGSDKMLTKLLVGFALSKIELEKSWNIDKELRKFSALLLKEDSQIHLDKLKSLKAEDFNKLNSELREYNVRFENTLAKTAREAMTIISGKNLEASAFYRGSTGIFSYFRRIAERDFSKLVPGNYVMTTINEDKWYSSKASPNEISAIDKIKEDLITYYHQIQKNLGLHYENYVLYNQIYTSIYPIAVLNEIEKLVGEIKEENNMVHISEFNRRIAGIVLNEPVPFIYERLGEKYKYFLIDEFQDTSILQWQNLLPLVDNSLSEDNINLIVGDGKQAIYRWRNGEVEQFASLPKLFSPLESPYVAQREASLVRHFNEKFLDKNYRSAPEIIDFNNKLFNHLSQFLPEEYMAIYSGVSQKWVKSEKAGYINLELYDRSSAETGFKEFNLTGIRNKILEAIEDHYSHQDIAIICRTNKDASATARFLIREGIPVVSSESLMLGSSPELNFLIACLKYLLDPLQKIFQAHILLYLRESKRLNNTTISLDRLNLKHHPTDLFDERTGSNVSFSVILDELGFSLNRDYLRKLNIYDLFEELIRIFKLNEGANPFIQFFLDAVHDYAGSSSGGVSDFINWWEDNKDKTSVILPESLDAVRILTIHKAKGLEFPVVIYPYADESVRPDRSGIWFTLDPPVFDLLDTVYLNCRKELEETSLRSVYDEEKAKLLLDLVNLLYVVLTRPTDRLYIISSLPSKTQKEKLSVPSFFKDFLTQTGNWQEGKNCYEFGRRVKTSIKKVENVDTEVLDQFISNDWRERLILSTVAPEVWDVEAPDAKTEWGKLVHLLFSRIKYRTDLDEVLHTYHCKGYLDKTEIEEVRKLIENVLMHPELKQYYEPGIKVKTEADIIDVSGDTYRPDRIVFDHNELVIIDYKTGGHEPSHSKQIGRYATLLREMGYQKIKPLLVYIGEPSLVMEV